MEPNLKRQIEGKSSESKLIATFQNKYFELLMTEAANTPIENNDSGSFPLLHWVNPYLIDEGQAFFKKNLDSVLYAHFVGLTIAFSYKPIASVLLRSGGTHVKYNARMRYLSTILHLKKWYESDLLRKSAKGAQDVNYVRKLHAKVLDLLLSDDSCVVDEEDLILTDEQECLLKTLLSDAQSSSAEELSADFNSYDPEVLMSQLDMVLIQYAFMGFIAMAPETFGIHDRMGLTGFIHIWAVIGTLLGIDDRFNLGLHQDQQSLDLISQYLFVPCFKRLDEGVFVLWQGMFDGVGKFAPFLKLKPVLYFIYKDILKIPSTRLHASLSRYELFSYHRQAWNLNHAKRNYMMKQVFNILTRIDIHFAAKKFMRNSPNIY
ncbi:uncharacterized protein LOC110842170 [Folsomia candida]|uniref:uncharacterized protein LOC110842170 n=1 Tax=Folsomia candida TaxID=158441 RepID=UPI000B8FB522|nr:uncharacterized protein LOC110842170 [Folsomia candida]